MGVAKEENKEKDSLSAALFPFQTFMHTIPLDIAQFVAHYTTICNKPYYSRYH